MHGDESLVSKHPKHTLLLVYPGPNDMALKALQQYKGNILLYVGELASKLLACKSGYGSASLRS